LSYSYEYESGGSHTQRAGTLDLGDYLRSRSIARFFFTRKFSLPDSDSPAYDPNLDYQDVKLKIVQTTPTTSTCSTTGRHSSGASPMWTGRSAS
jgi:hypothetical protein